jgi:hypothetical protein
MSNEHPKPPQSIFSPTKGGQSRLVSSGVYYARFKHAGKQYEKWVVGQFES